MRKPTISCHMNKVEIGYLYALRCEQFVKVGVTLDLARRVSEVKAVNPFPVHAEMCRALKRSYMFVVEKEIHRILRAYHHDGEWFTASQREVRRATAKALREAQRVAAEDVRVLGICIPSGFGGQRVYLNPNTEQAFGIIMHSN